KYTKDGRPLLWKHRDTWALNNKLVQFNDGKYQYTGLVNSVDTLGKSVWIGFNSTGFAIMNSASYNLNNDTIKQSGLEGRIMKKALQNCASVKDFEKLLQDLPQPTRLEANFGVIDSKGGAAYFELGNYKVVKIDANDPAIAPDGYIIRTNFSFTGKAGKGGGYIRYETANKVFSDAVKRNELSAQTIIQKGSRNLTHALTGTNLWDYADLKKGEEKMVFFYDYIPRKSTSSSVIIEGVQDGEEPILTTMWTVLGWPLTSVTIPIWLSGTNELPEVVTYNEKIKDAPLCHFALELKKECYTYKRGASSKYYMNINPLINAEQSGMMQLLAPLDNMLFDEGYKQLKKWREYGMDQNELVEFYKMTDQLVYSFYAKYFNLTIQDEEE
ncbi:MAG: hypothetical protein ABFS05_10095, partial [Bacteroidota bacterium]